MNSLLKEKMGVSMLGESPRRNVNKCINVLGVLNITHYTIVFCTVGTRQ